MRRALALLVVLAVLGAGGWWWWRDHRPGLGPGESYGVDVSSHQGPVDWRAVAEDGIRFAYLKATEGRDFTDRTFARNWADVRDAGLLRGAYHFFTLCSPGRDQAQHFLDVVGTDRSMLPPALDLEIAGNCSVRPPRAAVAQEVADWVEAVERVTGQQVLLYVGDDFEKAYGVALPRDRWVRKLYVRPDAYKVWQARYDARVDGIEGGVDLDLARW